jgi:hypothetical protein
MYPVVRCEAKSGFRTDLDTEVSHTLFYEVKQSPFQQKMLARTLGSIIEMRRTIGYMRILNSWPTVLF